MRVATLILLLIAFLSPSSNSQEPQSNESDMQTRLAELEREVARISRELKELRTNRQDGESRMGDPQLNGRWQYVTATEGETVTQYDEVKTELVIDGTKWTTLVDGSYMASDTHTVDYDFSTKPISFVRFARQWAPNSIAKAIIKLDGDRLIYTTTAFEDPSKHPLNGYAGAADAVPQYPQTPTGFDPKGTRNIRYILRRVSRTTKLPERKSQQFGGSHPGF